MVFIHFAAILYMESLHSYYVWHFEIRVIILQQNIRTVPLIMLSFDLMNSWHIPAPSQHFVACSMCWKWAWVWKWGCSFAVLLLFSHFSTSLHMFWFKGHWDACKAYIHCKYVNLVQSVVHWGRVKGASMIFLLSPYSLQLNDKQALATGQHLYRKAYNTTGPFQKLLLD